MLSNLEAISLRQLAIAQIPWFKINHIISQKVSISALNVKNIKSNFLYSKYLTSMSNITFLSELWLKKNELNHLKDLCLNKKKFLFTKKIKVALLVASVLYLTTLLKFWNTVSLIDILLFFTWNRISMK